VFSGAVFPTCTGINPHLTLMAITARASRQLIERLGSSVPTRASGAQV
jgi:gluconate 2-dehydrogenase alpha chain